jgi:hypothetical protein
MESVYKPAMNAAATTKTTPIIMSAMNHAMSFFFFSSLIVLSKGVMHFPDIVFVKQDYFKMIRINPQNSKRPQFINNSNPVYTCG